MSRKSRQIPKRAPETWVQSCCRGRNLSVAKQVLTVSFLFLFIASCRCSPTITAIWGTWLLGETNSCCHYEEKVNFWCRFSWKLNGSYFIRPSTKHGYAIDPIYYCAGDNYCVILVSGIFGCSEWTHEEEFLRRRPFFPDPLNYPPCTIKYIRQWAILLSQIGDHRHYQRNRMTKLKSANHNENTIWNRTFFDFPR